MITQAELKKYLHYDPVSGMFTWLISNGNKGEVGNTAGTEAVTGYIVIGINRNRYYAHRLVWLYTYGYFPEHHIDHLNGIKDDNRIENLRHVTVACNMQNTKMHNSNTSGFTGVSKDKSRGTWMAYIEMFKKRRSLGRYPTALEAALARYTAEVQCPLWTCNHRSKLTQAIKAAWPDFRPST